MTTFGLTISTKKPGKPYVKANTTIKGQLKVVEKLTYFGSTLLKSIIMDDKVNAKLLANSEATKIKVYGAVTLTTYLYGCEMWTTYQWHIKKLNHFLRQIM